MPRPSTGPEIIELAKTRMGFLTKDDVQIIAADPTTRLQPILIRCHRCRLITPAQDVTHIVTALEANGYDYVRDCSIPAAQE